MATGFFVGLGYAALVGAAVGAVVGGIMAAVNGGNIFKGMLTGAIGGAITGALTFGLASALSGVSTVASNVANSSIQGGNSLFGTSAAGVGQGAASSSISSVTSSMDAMNGMTDATTSVGSSGAASSTSFFSGLSGDAVKAAAGEGLKAFLTPDATQNQVEVANIQQAGATERQDSVNKTTLEAAAASAEATMAAQDSANVTRLADTKMQLDSAMAQLEKDIAYKTSADDKNIKYKYASDKLAADTALATATDYIALEKEKTAGALAKVDAEVTGQKELAQQGFDETRRIDENAAAAGAGLGSLGKTDSSSEESLVDMQDRIRNESVIGGTAAYV